MADSLMQRLMAAKGGRPTSNRDYLDDPNLFERLQARWSAQNGAIYGEIEEAPPMKETPKRKRMPSMADAARLAAKECVEVKIAADGTVTVTPVKPLDIMPTNDENEGNEWDRLQ